MADVQFARRQLVTASFAATFVPLAFSAPAAVLHPLLRPAQPVAGASRAVLLDVVQAGQRLVVVGERGIIVVSDDAGKNWAQVKVPVSVTLTAVAFPTPTTGWAVGHSGVVLHSTDGGQTWTQQLDGRQAASLALSSAESLAKEKPSDPFAQQQLGQARQLSTDGADKPFLSLYFSDADNGFVVGAYGLIFRTRDGGKSWLPWMHRTDNPKGLHLYCVRAHGDTVLVAGEQGLLMRSHDRGENFARLSTPYRGTFFTMALGGNAELVLAGLRGNVYRSGDGAKTFQKLDMPGQVTVNASVVMKDGQVVLADQAGRLHAYRPGDAAPKLLSGEPQAPIAGIAETADGGLMTVGYAGVKRVAAAPRGRMLEVLK